MGKVIGCGCNKVILVLELDGRDPYRIICGSERGLLAMETR